MSEPHNPPNPRETGFSRVGPASQPVEDPHDVRYGRILNRFLAQRERGEPASEAELFAQYPEFADELREDLELLRDLQPVGPDSQPVEGRLIDELVAAQVLNRSSDPEYLASLGPYKITDYLGRGGMGVVLKAHEPALNRTVAIKLLKPELAHDRTALARFTREAKAAAALQHPNIVTVYAVGEQRGTHFIAMEYVDGPTLADLIRDQGPLPPDGCENPAGGWCENPLSHPARWCENPFSHPVGIRHVFDHLLTGLAAAHRAGLIHRDIKPSNLLLAGLPVQTPAANRAPTVREGSSAACPASSEVGSRFAGDDQNRDPTVREGSDFTPHQSPSVSDGSSVTLKIADFGLARMLSAETRMTLPDSVFGTPQYMSPQQARGDANIDHRTDLYSAGVVLYEMLTGRTPFRADTPSAVIHQILHDDPPAPQTITDTADPHLASLALRLMAKQPEDRFSSATQAMTALKAGERIRSPVGRRRLGRQLAVAAVIVAVACTALWVAGLVLRPPVIEYVRIEQYGGKPTTNIQVKYAGESTWTDFHDFGDAAGSVTGAELVDLPDAGEQLVVAGTAYALGDYSLFAFDAKRRKRWSMDLSPPETIGNRWPDCEGVPSAWVCRHLRSGNLDEKDGEEIVLAACSGSREYPTRISIVKPRWDRGEVCSTYWHLGHIWGLRVELDFFGDKNAAIIAWGLNNKLDGFGDPPPRPYPTPPPGEDDPETEFDKVSVMMVLDPKRMDGLVLCHS